MQDMCTENPGHGIQVQGSLSASTKGQWFRHSAATAQWISWYNMWKNKQPLIKTHCRSLALPVMYMQTHILLIFLVCQLAHFYGSARFHAGVHMKTTSDAQPTVSKLHTSFVKKLPWISARYGNVSWNWTKQFNDMSQMILITWVIFTRMWLKQVVTGCQFKRLHRYK